VQLPLNFLGTQSTGNVTERRAARRDYLLARDQLHLELRSRWQALRTEAAQLERRRELLVRAGTLAGRIEEQLQALRVSNEVEGEILLQRLLDVIETRAEVARAEVLIGRNEARLRQAAGRSL
jgi:hypothetical protein